MNQESGVDLIPQERAFATNITRRRNEKNTAAPREQRIRDRRSRRPEENAQEQEDRVRIAKTIIASDADGRADPVAPRVRVRAGSSECMAGLTL